jgi:ABC-type multidrug transport system ATPase subunit
MFFFKLKGKMLSGGEKKRLAFATELLTHPSILFCDEPTTGLDSHNAQKLIGTLQRLARSQNTAIMCTIHQPSSQLFAMFDQVLLLADGRTAFYGKPREAMAFFEDLGYFCPENYNPADYLIGVLAIEGGHERASQRVAQRICDNFAVSLQFQQTDLVVNLEMHMYESGNYKVKKELENYKKPFWCTTVFYLTKRFVMNVLRDPTVQLLRILQKVAIAIMAGLVLNFLIISLYLIGDF